MQLISYNNNKNIFADKNTKFRINVTYQISK